MNLIFCGFPGCGKTTFGRWIAKKEKKNFIDTDLKIEENYLQKTGESLSCRDIYINLGEKKFRILEAEAISSLKDVGLAIISIGGGALTHDSNHEVLKRMGLLVYLHVEPTMLYASMQSKGLPAFIDPNNPKESFDELYQQRTQQYHALANIQIDKTNKNYDEIYEELITCLSGVQYGQ